MKDELKKLGFTDKETSVYLAMIDLGQAVVSDIAKRAGVKRPTAYVILGTLGNRGLVSFTERRGVKLFTPAPVERLIKNLEEEAKRYKKFADMARKLAPKLRSKKSKGGLKPNIQLFEGVEGIKQVRSVYEDTLTSLESVRARAIAKGGVKLSQVSREELGTMPEITVHGNKIILISPEEKFAAVVESKELAEKLKRILVSAKNNKNRKPFLKPNTSTTA